VISSDGLERPVDIGEVTGSNPVLPTLLHYSSYLYSKDISSHLILKALKWSQTGTQPRLASQ
jgi:hypothetical protein